MTLRYALSRLNRADARRAFGRTWLWICLGGTAITFAADGGRHLFLILVAWLVCVFAPVRIAVEALHSAGPRWRRALQQDLLLRPDRYASHERTVLMVEWLAGREVHVPRLAPPDLAVKIVEAASRLCGHALRTGGSGGVRRAATRCASLLHRWIARVAAGEQGALPPHDAAGPDGAASPDLWNPRASIQDQWKTLRAIAGLAGLTKVLVAVYEDSAGAPLGGGGAIRAEADAAMDYVDQVGLRLDGPAWEEVPGVPAAAVPPDAANRIAETWMAFCAVPLPAPRRLAAFIDAVQT